VRDTGSAADFTITWKKKKTSYSPSIIRAYKQKKKIEYLVDWVKVEPL
jgi:hypothetical protein